MEGQVASAVVTASIVKTLQPCYMTCRVTNIKNSLLYLKYVHDIRHMNITVAESFVLLYKKARCRRCCVLHGAGLMTCRDTVINSFTVL